MRRLFISVHWSSDEAGREKRRRAPIGVLVLWCVLIGLVLALALVRLANP